MPNPKRRHSTRRTANRRAHDFLTASGSPSARTATRRSCPTRACPKCGAYKGRAFWTVEGSRSKSNRGAHGMLIDIALDAVGSDKAPEPEIRGAILACRALPVRVHLIGPEPELRDLLDEHLENEDLPIVIHHASERIGMDEKAAHAVRTKKRQLHARGPEAGARGQGRGICDRRQYRRRDGHGQDGAGRAAGRRPAGAGHADAHLDGEPVRAARCGRKRGLQAAQPGAIRRDGRDVCPAAC